MYEGEIIEFRVSSPWVSTLTPHLIWARYLVVLGLSFFNCHAEMIIASVSLDVKIKMRDINYMPVGSSNSCSQSWNWEWGLCSNLPLSWSWPWEEVTVKDVLKGSGSKTSGNQLIFFSSWSLEGGHSDWAEHPLLGHEEKTCVEPAEQQARRGLGL